MTDEPLSATTTVPHGRVPVRSPIAAPTVAFALLLALEAWLFPPRPPALDAGPIETWITFGLANLLIFLTVFGVSLGLFWLGRRLAAGQRHPVSSHVVGAVILSVCLLLLGVAARWYGQMRASSDVQRYSTLPVKSSVGTEKTELSGRKPVIAFVTVQSSEGVTEANLNQETLRNLEDWIVAMTRQRAKDSFAQQGFDPKNFNPKIVSTSVYVVAGGKKLAVVRLRIDESVRMVSIMGIIGDQMHRVGCIRDSNQEVPVWSGPCGDKVKDIFGVSLRP